jgi:hypothetical protein
VSGFLGNISLLVYRSACNPTPEDWVDKAVIAILILSQQSFSNQLPQSNIKRYVSHFIFGQVDYRYKSIKEDRIMPTKPDPTRFSFQIPRVPARFSVVEFSVTESN